MALKIRLRQQGRTNRPFYRLVVTDSRYPRDGKYVEALGWYNPIENEEDKSLCIKADRIQYWLSVGAQLTDKAASLVAQSAPNVMREQTKKEVARKVKKTVRRRASKAV
jgi:small subunit ribosomal protein S16